MVGNGDGQLWGSGRGAIAGCHCNVLWLEGEGDDQFCGSGRGAIGGCHCSVLWWGEGRVTANFGGGRGAIVVCYGWWGGDQLLGSGRGAMCFISSFYIQGHQFHPETKESNNEFCVELLADVALFSTLITQKIVFLLSGVYAGIINRRHPCWPNHNATTCLFWICSVRAVAFAFEFQASDGSEEQALKSPFEVAVRIEAGWLLNNFPNLSHYSRKLAPRSFVHLFSRCYPGKFPMLAGILRHECASTAAFSIR